MKALTLRNIYEFINSDEATHVSIDLIQPIHNSECKAARKLNITISGDISKETKEFLQSVEERSWCSIGMFKAAYKLKAKNIMSLEPLGYDFYTVKNDTNASGVCNQEGDILWCWITDENGEDKEILPLGILEDSPESVVDRIVASWFDLYQAGYNTGHNDAQ